MGRLKTFLAWCGISGGRGLFMLVMSTTLGFEIYPMTWWVKLLACVAMSVLAGLFWDLFLNPVRRGRKP